MVAQCSVWTALCVDKTLSLYRDYVEDAVDTIFEAHTNDAFYINIERKYKSSLATLLDVHAVRVDTMPITQSLFIINDIAYASRDDCYYACEYADCTLALSTRDSPVPAPIRMDILRLLDRYRPIQSYIYLTPRPREEPEVATLFPAQFPYCSPVLMNRLFLAIYARHIPADGQLQVAWVSDIVAAWLAKLRLDSGDPRSEWIFFELPTMEDTVIALAVLSELGIH